jgi:hypothetical protein
MTMARYNLNHHHDLSNFLNQSIQFNKPHEAVTTSKCLYCLPKVLLSLWINVPMFLFLSRHILDQPLAPHIKISRILYTLLYSTPRKGVVMT